MTLEVLQKEMINAMKRKDKTMKDTLSALIGAVKKAAIDEKCRENVPESLVDKVILKEKKTVQEMIDTCPAEREELLKEYKERLNIIEAFAPVMMTKEEIKQFINDAIAAGEVHNDNKGMVMKYISPRLKGKADMKMVNQIVTDICNKVTY